ncbi:MAG: hypothetical protein WB919_08000 [Candidatus Sulfotelmatobacter sp.]
MNGKAIHRAVVVGAGLGGLNAATALAGADEKHHPRSINKSKNMVERQSNQEIA